MKKAAQEEYIEVYCPECGKLIFRFKKGTRGTIEIFCRRCRMMRQIKLQ